MSETTMGGPAPAVTAESFLVEKHGFWGNFYRMVWGIAAALLLMLILMAIFLT